ncbi:MAG: hypothetical protein ACFFDN_35230 [Candidatus Hodarchaeota archaeon]
MKSIKSVGLYLIVIGYALTILFWVLFDWFSDANLGWIFLVLMITIGIPLLIFGLFLNYIIKEEDNQKHGNSN